MTKKMFTQTSSGFGFAPVLNKDGWCLMMFDSREDFEQDKPNDDFLLQDPIMTEWHDYWKVASILKGMITRINTDVENWMKAPKQKEKVDLIGGINNPFGWKLD